MLKVLSQEQTSLISIFQEKQFETCVNILFTDIKKKLQGNQQDLGSGKIVWSLLHQLEIKPSIKYFFHAAVEGKFIKVLAGRETQL